ncbi:MAG: NAD-dependent epimerase/dehydratase family protein [Gemmatimonadaceae bacterium]
MKVLVTGGTGVVGRATVTALIDRGHTVRLVSRNARRDAAQWGSAVESWTGDVAKDDGLSGVVDGCDAVLHVVGVVHAPDGGQSLREINVEGTQRMLREAIASGGPRFVFVSSLGADRGESDYHRSKREAEALVREYPGSWTIVRPGNVYGPGDDEISLLLRMVRTLPVIPVIGGGDTKFQPIYAGDLGRALAMSVERSDLAGRVLEVAGVEQTSQNELIDHFSRITNREPARVGVPEFLTSFGISIAEAAGVPVPFHHAQLQMLREGNSIPADRVNALTAVFGITPTPLEEGLRILADALPEALPSEGVGALKRKQFWADIAGSSHTPESLFALFRQRFGELTPMTMDLHAEPDTPKTLEEGATLTMALPLRGNVQVRVEEITDRRATLCTLAGHPLAGAVRFIAEDRGAMIRFQVEVYDRPASLVDYLVMRPVGELLQSATWDKVVESVVRASGGRAVGGIQHEEAVLDADQSERIEEWLRDLVMHQRREASRSGDAPGAGEGTRTDERRNSAAGDLHTGGFGGETRAEL